MKVELLSITENSEQLIELCGRTAYQSYDKIHKESASKFIKMLVNRQHFSVFEHCTATFKISDVSRAFSHQLVRHRIASYTQKSQRYVSEKEFDFVIPDSIKENWQACAIFEDMMDNIKECYQALQEVGIKNEDARFVLPNACTTEIVITANFRVWRHIIGLRTEKHAQWEIQNVCREILKILKEKATTCFSDLEI